METSQITTESQLMALAPKTKVYIFSNGDIKFWNVLAPVPYNTMNYMAFYEGTDTIMLSKNSLNSKIVFTDHDEAYQFLADEYRRRANTIEEIYLNK